MRDDFSPEFYSKGRKTGVQNLFQRTLAKAAYLAKLSGTSKNGNPENSKAMRNLHVRGFQIPAKPTGHLVTLFLKNISNRYTNN